MVQRLSQVLFPLGEAFDMRTSPGAIRRRVHSFGSLLNEGALAQMQQKLSDTLERQVGRFAGAAGLEIYRFAWQRMNHRVVFHICFYSTLGSVLAVLWAIAAWQLWLVMGLWVARRLLWTILGVTFLALLPPSFPNAAAHGLSLALIAAELVLLGINLVLFGLVHLAVLLNKYILPHWLQRGRVMVAEISSGVIDHNGRANVSMAQERNKLLLALETAKTYPEYHALAGQLDKLPADNGEGGDEWRRDEGSDAYDAALCRIYLSVMRRSREGGDADALGLALRTVLHRNFAGIDRLLRLRHARAGTKTIAEEFVGEVCRSVRFLGGAGTPAYNEAVNGWNTNGHQYTNGGSPGFSGLGQERDKGEKSNGAGGGVKESIASHGFSRHYELSSSAEGSGRLDSPRGVSMVSLGHRLDSSTPLPPIDTRVPETLRLVSEAHRSLGRTALCLSGGGALAMYHFGVIKVLLEEGLLPQVISGTSGGSIVAAFISIMPEEELRKTIRPDMSSRHGMRWFPPVWKMLLHFVQHGVAMPGERFAATTKAYFGDITFAEAFVISRRAVSIQVSVGSGHGFVLNHFTAPQVVIRTAVNASCALPGLMQPFELLAKDDKTGELIPFHPPGVSSFDGTITADIPAARLTELFNCNNFIVSQVNPHLNFVLHLAEEGQGRRQRQARSGDRRAAVTKLLRVANFLLLNIKYGIQKLLEVDLLNLRMVRTLQGILVQDFRGHITVLPHLEFRDYMRIMHQPNEKDMERFIVRGEKATWPHIEAIRLTMAAEIALQEAAAALRARQAQQKQSRRSAGDFRGSGGHEGGGGLGKASTAYDDGVAARAGAPHAAHLGAGLSCAVEPTKWH